MIIQDRQRMALTYNGSDRSLEVHLPQAVGRGMFKALPVFAASRSIWINETVAVQYRCYGATSWHRYCSQILQAPPDLASSPTSCLSQRDDLLFCNSTNPAGYSLRPPAAIPQTGFSLLPKAIEPLVTGFAADIETATQFTETDYFRLG
jgi:hypothetical protein